MDGLDLKTSSLIVETTHGDLLLRESLVERLVSAHPELRRDLVVVRDRSSGRVLPWRLIAPEIEAPPFDQSTTGVVRQDQCPVCRRDGHFDNGKEPLRPVISKARMCASVPWFVCGDVDRTPVRFLRSWEFYGVGRRRAHVGESDDVQRDELARPLVLATGSLSQLIRDASTRNVQWIPVSWVE